MGLDTYAGRHPPTDADWDDDRARFGLTDDDLAAFEQAEAGDNYFRGKLFDALVRHVTGVGLYQKWIPPETVRFMAEAFEDCDSEATIREYDQSSPIYEHSAATIDYLRRFFQVCADRQLGLVGSW